jgi:hypothetical protein
MFKDLFRAVASVAVLGIATSLSGCDGNITIDGMKGVPLAELDLTGPAPKEVALLGPDRVHLIIGDKLAISVDGDDTSKARLRFSLNDGKLGISRDHWKMGEGSSTVTINVTMPAPNKLIMAGSGQIDADSLSGDDANITIAGSGSISSPNTNVGKLKIDIAGSGSAKAAGTARDLKSNIAGSGSADLAALKVGQADITVAGSGNASFASDGDVKATIMGSGEVRVTGHAKCTVKSMGSGRLVCESPAATAKDDEEPKADASDEN